eukprot:TRINITY_DN5831_c0_g4_i1.p1 TRINITY_DN5831_c0_g4~~TRINITY_DN5831_c0_g4_i1.p1  ORF type:complete len:260 (-),score=87.10 TRINITY_DN5831_c0_g4_i1:102-881(-)
MPKGDEEKTKGGDYKALPIRKETSVFPRYAFVKEHHDKGQLRNSSDGGKTIFVTNFGSNDLEVVKSVFGVFGPIESVVFGKFGGGSATDAHSQEVPYVRVTFRKKKSAEKALKLDSTSSTTTTTTQHLVGLEKWVAEHKAKHVDVQTLQKEVDAFMKAFDKQKALEQLEREAKANMPDEDGFITVGKGRGRKGATDGEISVRGIRTTDVKQKKEKVLIDFYRFQKMEARQQEIAELRKKFEHDKQRIAHLKAQRKFRPY